MSEHKLNAELGRCLLLVAIVFLTVEFCGANTYQVQRVIQRMDEMERKLLTEATHRREDIYFVHLAINRIEERLNDTLNRFEADGGLSPEFEIPGELILDDVENVSYSVQILKKYFQNEKVLNERVRRHVSDIDDVIKILQDKMLEASDDTKRGLSVLEELMEKNNGLETDLGEMSKKFDILPDLLDEIREIKETLVACTDDNARPKSCLELLKSGQTKSGIYEVYPLSTNVPIKVYCDQETTGGGWTVFQRRQDGSVNFYRGWYDYEVGFGNLEGEFWLGNENINRALFAKCCYELRIELEDFDTNKRHAQYDNFMVGPKSGDYVLTAEGYIGDAGDSLRTHNGHSFSTKDYGKAQNCANEFKGAWWYYSCHSSNLNGLYLSGKHDSHADGVEWYYWTGHNYSLKFVEMKFREHAED